MITFFIVVYNYDIMMSMDKKPDVKKVHCTFFRRAFHFGYTNKISLISDVIKNRGSDLFNRITNDTGHVHVLYDLLPPKCNRALRERGHDFILPKVKTE